MSNDEDPAAATASLYAAGSADGLPVVPPTEERVAELLRGTDLPPEHEIGTLGNREGRLTVRTLAVNAVMAGCNPLHVPVLEAGARALVDPDANAIQVSVSTGSWAYWWLLNGPIRDTLGLRSGAGAFGPGAGPNRVIGRALGLAYRNTAVIHPGEKDMGVQGNPFRYSLVAAENEAASPWEPYHVSAGFDADESTVTFGGPHGFAQYTTPGDADAGAVLESMVRNTPASVVGIRGESVTKTAIHAVPPERAETLAEAGRSKADVKTYLHENATLPSRAYNPGVVLSWNHEGEGGVRPHRVPQYDDPDRISLVVVGGAGGEHAAIGGAIGGPVTKRVRRPDGWETLVEEYG